MKFCKNCGTLGRGDKLKLQHMKYCQPGLQEGESGFLLDGRLPELEHEQFRAMLRIIGGNEKPLKPLPEDEEDSQREDTVSDSLSNISSSAGKEELDQEQQSSQVSFGQKSHISSSNNLQISTSPLQRMETPGNDDEDAEENAQAPRHTTQ